MATKTGSVSCAADGAIARCYGPLPERALAAGAGSRWWEKRSVGLVALIALETG